MPAPCTSAEGWEAVKATAIARNSIKEAAGLHNVPYAAAKQRASREKWPVGRRPAKNVQQAKQVDQQQLAKISHKSVTTVTSTADALSKALEEDNRETRLSLSVATRKAAKTFRKMPGGDIIGAAQNLKHVVSSASQIHSWDEGGTSPGLTLNFLSLSGDMGIQINTGKQ
jgi:hypothetical protein